MVTRRSFLGALAAAGAVVQEDIAYASSIDPCHHLAAHVAYPAEKQGLPVLVVMHGFRMRADSFTAVTYQRFASAGTFVLGVEMRGRGKSDCKPDSGGREVYDILDAVRFVLAQYPERTDPSQIHVAGYSGGGGNALSCAARFPDTFNTVTSFFGISDYEAWYGQANGAQQKCLVDWIGGTPAEVPGAYRSRASASAITNYTGGHLWLFHDRQDQNVPASHSDAVEAAMRAAGLRNCNYAYTDAGAAPRWLHAAPNAPAPVIEAEQRFLAAIANKEVPAWSIPERGRLQIAGYLETRRFSVWLGDGTAGRGYVSYDLPHRRFSVACSPSVPVRLRIGREAWQTRTADSDGSARFQP
jgi:pimeloyl-ACP methyl ester carboxylesterase